MKKLIYLGLAGALTIGNFSMVSAQNSFTVNQLKPIKSADLHINTQEKKEEVRVTTGELKSKSDILQVDFKIPVVQGLKDKEIQSEINTLFQNQVLASKDEIQKFAIDGYKEFKKQGLIFSPYTISTSYEVPYSTNKILSTTIIFEQYAGGAHKSHTMKTYNLDLETGKEITLKNLFNKDVKYKKIITEEIKKQMKQNEENYFPKSIEKLETISEDKPFYFTDDGIVIYYNPYEIAPYASGTPKFKIPFDLFKDSVKEEFLKN